MKKRMYLMTFFLVFAFLLTACERNTRKGPPRWAPVNSGSEESGDKDRDPTEPAVTEPAGTDPGETDPGGTPPGTDPGETDPGGTPQGPDLGGIPPGGTDPGDDDPGVTPPDLGVGTGDPETEDPPSAGMPIGYEARAWIDKPEAIESVTESVVKLEVYDRNGDRIATGSGFCTFQENLLVTAAHVVVNMEYMIAVKDDGETFRIDRVLCGTEESDIAICLLPEGQVMTPLPLLAATLPRGERVVAIGSQFGAVNLVTFGNLAGIWESEQTSRLIFTAPVSAGNSGGPLFDSAGSVIGVISGTYDKGQNMNFASPILSAINLYNTLEQE